MTIKYSKKVMQHFLHPKNMGEIKNPDGVGKVGNPTCLLPDEKIYSNNGFIDIKNVEKNDLVFSHNLTKNKILEKFSRNYEGKIIRFKNALGYISLTPEHLIYALSLPIRNKFKRNKGKRDLIPAWYHADQLKKGDIILYPFSQNEKDKKYLTIDIPKPKYDFKSKNIPLRIPLNFQLLKLMGYFISEGNVQDKPCKTYISFALHIKEVDIAADIKKIVKTLFNLEIKIRKVKEKNGLVVYIYNAQLARFFKKLFGNGAANKKFPEFIMDLPFGKQKSLIRGLWRGDGYISLNRKGPRGGYATISYQLAQQIKLLLLRQGVISSVYVEKEKTSKWANHKKVYRIHVGQRESLKKLCKILNLKYSPKSYELISSWINHGFLYTPITKIEKIKYIGKVYNLEVEKTHSFSSEAFCLHNCGDIMYVYIKVDKKKKIIKDIKFKTFGCAAAIATSSVITQLAKGKKFEDAKKITRDGIAKSLDGLPPIKMHCSNLAIEALKKAILDYEDKAKHSITLPKRGQSKAIEDYEKKNN